MAEQTVTYLIGKDGKITVEVNGVRGPGLPGAGKGNRRKAGRGLSVRASSRIL